MLTIWLCVSHASAQATISADSTKVTTSMFTLDAGYGSQRDTYVSSIAYSWRVALTTNSPTILLATTPCTRYWLISSGLVCAVGAMCRGKSLP